MYINMSVNPSSFADLPFLPPHPSSSNSSFHPFMDTCFRSKMSIFVFSALSTANILLLPVFIFVLYLGYQQWRKQRSVSTAATSHSDYFTYHSIAMQLNEFLGFNMYFCGGYINLPEIMMVGTCIWSVNSTGQSLFQLLTCVERYLAVVHPVIYLGLKQARGIRIRNISVGCVWLLSVGWLAVYYLTSYEFSFISYLCMMASSTSVILFCSISVVCALKLPGPGEVGGHGDRVDQSKQRAFHTIMAIMGVLLFRFWGRLIAYVIHSSGVLQPSNTCLILLSAFWFNQPSSLVLPLLYLHRAGKLQCRKQNTESAVRMRDGLHVTV